MRTHALALLLLSACGPSAPPTTAAFVPGEPEPAWIPVVSAGLLQVDVRDRLVSHEGGSGLLLRVVNHAETPVLVDLRSAERVIGPDVPAALRLPLSEAQRSELSSISALAQVGSVAPATYAVAFAPAACDGARDVALGGILVALDDVRTLELVADGANARVSCAAPTAAPAGTMWVAGSGALTAAATSAEEFAAVDDPLLRAASVTQAADVALLPFSYDARPVERWRYDACVSLGRCPARVLPQPPGSIRAPAVGMTPAGVEAFCQARSLRSLSPEETAAVSDLGRALVDPGDHTDLVVTGFRCARSESQPPSPP